MIYLSNIEKDTESNKYYRKVVYTGKIQLVLMSIKPNEEIGSEVHKKIDQFIRIEKGIAILVLNNERIKMKSGDAVVIPAGTKHNIINRSKTRDLKIYTIYGPSEHRPNTKQMKRPT